MNNYVRPEEETLTPAEKEFEKALRPLEFDDFNGQSNIVENLQVFVKAAKMREEALDVMATCIRLINLEMPVERRVKA